MAGLNFKNNEYIQDRFCEVLKENGNISQSAEAVGVGRTTVYALIDNDKSFAEKVSEARLEYTGRMAKQFREAAPDALEVLREIMQDKNAPATARANAAGRIIDYSKDFSEAEDFETKINQLKDDIAAAEAELGGIA